MPSRAQRRNTPETKDQLRLSFSTAILTACVISSSVKSSNDDKILSRIIGVNGPIFSSYARNAFAPTDLAAGASQPSPSASSSDATTGVSNETRRANSVFNINRSVPPIDIPNQNSIPHRLIQSRFKLALIPKNNRQYPVRLQPFHRR